MNTSVKKVRVLTLVLAFAALVSASGSQRSLNDSAVSALANICPASVLAGISAKAR